MIPLVFLVILAGEPYYEVEEVVVTATRYSTALKDVALAITIVDKEEIERLKPQSLADILKNSASIDVKDYGSAGSVTSISVRGVSASGVLVLLDGQPLNSILTGLADLSSIDVNSVERIEIVKGPASSLYGANGLGGVVNIITKKGSQLPITAAKVSSSTGRFENPFQTNEIHLKFSIPVKKIFYSIDGTKSSSAGFRTNSDFSGFKLRNLIGYKTGNLSLGGSFSLNLRDYGLPGPLPLIDSANPAPVLGDSSATSKYDRQVDRAGMWNIDAIYEIQRMFKISGKVFGNHQFTEFHTKFLSFVETVEDYQYNTNTYGAELNTTLNAGRHQLILGIDFRYDTLGAEKISKQTGDTIWNASSYNYGGWLAAKIGINDRLHLNPSFRYDKNKSYGEFFSPQLGFVVRATSELWIKLSAGRAFRAPGFNDLFWPVYGNPNLKPEYGNAYELRFETMPNSSTFTAISIFYREISDRITWMPTNEGLWKPQNLNYFSTKGVEAEFKFGTPGFINITFSLTYLLARQRNQELIYSYYDWMADTTHNEFNEIERTAAFVPAFSLSLALDFALPQGFYLHAGNFYNSKRYNYYENWSDYPDISMDVKSLKSSYVLDANLRRRFFNKLEITAGVKNLLDAKYSTQFGNSMSDRDYPMPGRMYFVVLEVQ